MVDSLQGAQLENKKFSQHLKKNNNQIKVPKVPKKFGYDINHWLVTKDSETSSNNGDSERICTRLHTTRKF